MKNSLMKVQVLLLKYPTYHLNGSATNVEKVFEESHSIFYLYFLFNSNMLLYFYIRNGLST